MEQGNPPQGAEYALDSLPPVIEVPKNGALQVVSSTPTPPAETPPPAATPPVEEKPKAPQPLIDLASDLGVPRERASQMTTEQLSEAIGIARAAWQQAVRFQPAQPQQSQPREPVSQVIPEPPKADPDALPFKHDPGDFDPEFLKFLKGMHKELQELRDYKAKVQNIEQREVHRETMTRAQFIDSLFAALPNEYESVFGKGSVDKVAGKPEYYRRMTVLQAMVDRQVPLNQFAAMMPEIAKELFPVSPAAPAGKPGPTEAEKQQLAARQQQYEQGRLGLPATRPAPASRENRAAEAVGEAMARAGVAVNGRAKLDDFLD